MIFLALGLAAIALLIWIGRGTDARQRQKRVAAGVSSVGLLVVAAITAFRGEWWASLATALMGGGLAMSARGAFQPSQFFQRWMSPPQAEAMSEAQARSLLGLGPEAGPAEVSEAYRRLMARVHPDAGGAAGLAAQLNAARDRLVGRRD
jgi:hypothetical protein